MRSLWCALLSVSLCVLLGYAQAQQVNRPDALSALVQEITELHERLDEIEDRLEILFATMELLFLRSLVAIDYAWVETENETLEIILRALVEPFEKWSEDLMEIFGQ